MSASSSTTITVRDIGSPGTVSRPIRVCRILAGGGPGLENRGADVVVDVPLVTRSDVEEADAHAGNQVRIGVRGDLSHHLAMGADKALSLGSREPQRYADARQQRQRMGQRHKQ